MTAFAISAGELHEAAEWAARGTPSKSLVPTLMGLLVEAGDAGLTLSGFDLERCASVTVDAVIRESGKLLIPARLLVDVAKVAGKAELQVAEWGSSVTVIADRARWTLPSLPH